MNRRGVALLLALVALLIVTGLATAVLAAARLRWLSGSRQLAARQAFEAAAGAVARHASGWDTTVAASLPPGGITALGSRHRSTSPETHDSLVRLGTSLFLIRSVGLVKAMDGSVLAQDGVAQLVEVMSVVTPDTMALAEGVVRRSRRDDVEILPFVRSVPRGWWRWP